MSRSAFGVFIDTMHRALDVTSASEPPLTPVWEDLQRAAIVMVVAGMDRYFVARFLEGIGELVEHVGLPDKLVALLEDSGVQTSDALRWGIEGMDVVETMRDRLTGHLSRLTTTHSAAIDGLFLAYGLKELSSHAANKAGIGLKELGAIVERRHQIAHGADVDADGKARPLPFDFAMRAIGEVGAFVKAAEEITTGRLSAARAATRKRLEDEIERSNRELVAAQTELEELEQQLKKTRRSSETDESPPAAPPDTDASPD